jgi:hypothetical protein
VGVRGFARRMWLLSGHHLDAAVAATLGRILGRLDQG